MDRRDAIIAGAGLGLGGLMAARPDQQYYPAQGGQQIPGSRTGKIRANQVIITSGGPNTGLFVYSGTPALGNPPVFSVVAPGVTHDPFGNAVTAVLEAGAIGTNFAQVTAAGRMNFYEAGAVTMLIDPAQQAMLYYIGGAALGNLVASISPSGGTDDFGQPFLDGIVSYLIVGNISAKAVRVGSGIISFYSATGQGQPWSSGPANISADGAFDLVLNGTTINAQAQIVATAGIDFTGATATGDKIILSRNGGAPLLDITDLANAGTAVIRVTVPSAAAQQIALSELVSGDANGRLVLDLNSTGNGRMRCGPGATAADTSIYRAAANLWASDYIAFDAGSNTAEAWNAVTFANGWANAGLEPGLQYRRVAAPDNCVQIVGAITVPAGFVSGQNITTALPAAYRPAKVNELTVYNANTNAPARITVTTGGVLQYQAGGNAAGNSLIIPAGNLVALTA